MYLDDKKRKGRGYTKEGLEEYEMRKGKTFYINYYE